LPQGVLPGTLPIREEERGEGWVVEVWPRQIRTTEHLEVLLLLFRNPERWWSAGSVVEELHISLLAAGNRLEELASGMLLDARVAESVMFRYKPVSASLEARVAGLARLYSELPVEIKTLIQARVPDHIRGFADAFRIRKRKDDA
jgi:hypothetical protein